jgi:hypothetical protein
MTQFDEREKAFERKFELDEERNFRIVAHATKELGRWAAEQMGLDEARTRSYIYEVLEADLNTPHHTRLISKVVEDFVNNDMRITPHDVGHQYDLLLAGFRKQILEGENDEAVAS